MNEKENFLQKYFPLNNLFFLLIIFSIGLIIRLYYLPFDLPIILDGESYFWYANDMSILGQLPTDFNSHNNFWSTILSLFFTINPSNNILDYMNLQRILSVVISTVTIFPMFFLCVTMLVILSLQFFNMVAVLSEDPSSTTIISLS